MRVTIRATLILVLVLILISAVFQPPATIAVATSTEHSSASQQRFQDINYWVRVFEDPARNAWQKPDEVVKAMNLKQGDVVADIGAGTGYFTRRFAVAVAPGGRVLGLDIERSMVEYMRQDAKNLGLHHYEARVVKADNPELPDRSVDVIFLCNTYHHIENRVVYFINAAKSLSPGGRVVIVDFYENSDFGPPREHKLAKDVALKEMKEAGFVLKRDLTILPQQYFLEYTLP